MVVEPSEVVVVVVVEPSEVVVVVVVEPSEVVVVVVVGSAQGSSRHSWSCLKVPPKASHCILVKPSRHSPKTQQAPASSGPRVVVVVVVVVVPQPSKRIEAQSPPA